MDGVPDTSSQEGSITAASVVMLLLATITASLRFYTRWKLLSGLKADDWLVLVALIFSIGVSIGFIRQSALALGHHMFLVSEEDVMASNKEAWYTFLFYAFSLSATKLSILLLYWKLLTYGLMRTLNYIVIVFVGAVSLWVIISEFIVCIPLEAVWDPRVQGRCLGLTVQLGNSILHIVTDFIIFSLPIPAIISLQLHWKQKLGVLVVFMFGFVVCILSIIRVVFLSRLDLSTDITYDLARVAYWGVIEVNLAIICACLTTIKPLLVKWFPKLLGSNVGTYAAESSSRQTREQPGRTGITSSHHRKSQRRSFVELRDTHNRLSTSEERSMEFIFHDLESQ